MRQLFRGCFHAWHWCAIRYTSKGPWVMSSWRIELVSCSYRCVSSLPCLLSRHPPRGRGSSNEENQGGGGFTQRRRSDAERQWEGGRRLGLSVIEVRGICVGVTIYIIPRFLPHTYPHDHSRLPATLCHGPCILFWPKGISSATTGCFASSSRSNAHSWLSTRRGRSRYRRSGRGESSLESDARPFICASASATPVRHAFSFSNYNFVCQLRNHMTFVVDNLQQYFMADVLESQFSILIRSVDQSTNFEDLSIAHDNFLAAVLTHTFVNNKAVSCRLKQWIPPPALTVFHYFS